MQKKVSHNFERTRAFVRTMMPQHTLPCVGGAYRLCHSYSTSVAHNTSVREQSVNQSAKEPHIKTCPLRSLAPIRRLATTSIARRGTIPA